MSQYQIFLKSPSPTPTLFVVDRSNCNALSAQGDSSDWMTSERILPHYKT